MRTRTFLSAHRWARRSLIGVVAAVVLYTALGFLLVPALARSIGQRQLSALLGRKVTIAQVRVNPYALSATVRGLRIHDRDGGADLFALKEAYVNLQLASVFKGGVVITRLRVTAPTIDVTRLAEDRYSFSDIMDKLAAMPPSDREPLRFALSNIELRDGHIRIDDRFKGTRHELAAINVSVPFISNFPYLIETYAQPAFSAIVNGTALAIQGRTKPFADSLESSIDVNLTKVDLPYYLSYLPVKLRVKLPSAILDTRLQVTFTQYRDRRPRLDLAGQLSLSQLKVVDEEDRPLLDLPRFEVAIASADLMANKLALARVLVRSPAVYVRRGANGELQAQSLLAAMPGAEPATPSPEPTRPGVAAAKPAPAAAAAPWLVEIADVALEDGRVVFTDAGQPSPFAATIAPLTIKLRQFTTARDGRAQLAVHATSDAGERLSIEGNVGIDPIAFDGTVAIEGVPLPRYAPYYASRLAFDIDQGVLSVSVPVKLVMRGDQLELGVTGLATELGNLELRRRGERRAFLTLPTLAVRETNFDLGRNELVLGDLTTTGGRVRLERGGAGRPWNLERLVRDAPAAPRGGDQAAATAGRGTATSKPLAFTLRKLDVSDFGLRVEDRAPGAAVVVAVDGLGVHVEDLGTPRGQTGRVTVQARVNRTGSLRVAGTVGLTPLSASLRLTLKTLPLVPLQPYADGLVALILTSGHVGADGRVTLASRANGMQLAYQGELSAGDLAAVEPAGGEELVRLGTLRLSGVDAVSEPFRLAVGEILLADFRTHVIVREDQTLNLAAIVPPSPTPASPAPPAPTAAAGLPPNVRIGAVVVSNGAVRFTDRSLSPAFATILDGLTGRIAGLSFAETERASVELKGRVAGGPVEIAGLVNPLAKNVFADLALHVSDVDLSAMTPYAGKYAGYAIDRGQLYLDIKVLLDGRKLDSKNKVRLAQFDFGRSIESKDATNLPVRLAVSLLKDRHGVIALDLPVNGSLDDPKFNAWRVAFMVVKNLLIKAATSPFALIGSFFGGGEELSWIEFEPGSAKLTAATRGKLDIVARALFERPGLHLDIEGHVDAARDLAALRKRALMRLVKAQKVKRTVAEGSDADAVVVTPDEYPKFLEKAYLAAKIARPKNALGMNKDLPVAEMERLLLASIQVSQDDLRILARARAAVVRQHIMRARSIETERVFLIEPKKLEPQRNDKARNHRVELRLK